MKKVVSLLLCAVMLIGLLPISAFAADGDKFILTADKTEVAAGDQIKITTTVESVSECDAMGLIFSFDHELFELVRISCNAELLDEYEESLIATSAAAKTEGKEGYAISFYDPQVYTGKVGNMFLKVKDDASFTSTTITAKTSNKLKGADVEYSVNEIVITMPTAETTAPTETEHVHTWTDVAAVEPTCDTDGNIAYQICNECGAAQTAGENPMPLSKFGWVLGALGHTWTDVAAVAPTCHADGNIAYQLCDLCGAAQTAGENPIPLSKFGWVLAAEHTGLVHHDAVAATCDTDGHEAYDYCEDCQVFVYADPLKLSYQDGVIPALGHDWVKYEAVAPSCNAEGNIAYMQCSVCGAAQTDEAEPKPLSKFGWVLAATGEHTFQHHDAIDATCDTEGHEAFDYCTTCECFFYADPLKLTYQAGIILPLGHTWTDVAAVAPTCHADGNIAYQLCDLCGAAQTAGENPIPLSKFGWVLAAQHTGLVHHDAVAATCDTDGHEAYDYCEDCQVFVYADPLKLSYQDGVIPAGHTWVEYEAVAPTCDTEGNIAYKRCSGCGEAWTLEEEPVALGKDRWVLAALGHTWVDHAAVEPTCDAEGNIAYQQCSVCGTAQTAGENPIPLTKYGWVLGVKHSIKHVEAKTATAEAEGNVEYWYCEDCGSAWLDENMTKVTNLKSVITPKLEAEEKPAEKPEETKPAEKPEADNDKTGDATPVVALIVMAVLAMFGMALVVVNKKKFSA